MNKKLNLKETSYSGPGAHEARPEWAAVQAYLDNQLAKSTRDCYRSSVSKFRRWCVDRALEALPASPKTVAMFLAAEAESGMRVPTLARHKAAIRQAHLAAELDDPTGTDVVRSVLKGIKRTVGMAQKRKAPATLDKLRHMSRATDGSLRGFRDRAILLLGFAGAFRRSELANLKTADLAFEKSGLRVTVRRSKTDQDAVGQVVEINAGDALCPIRAIEDWLAAAPIKDGYLFRRIRKGDIVTDEKLTPHGIGAIVKSLADEAGLDSKNLGAHSLRSGYLTEAASRGASVWSMMAISRHTSVTSVQPYVRL